MALKFQRQLSSGGGGKALMTRPLRVKHFFFAASQMKSDKNKKILK